MLENVVLDRVIQEVLLFWKEEGKKMHLLTGAFLNLLRLSHPANFKQVSEFSPQAMKKFKPDSS